MRVCLSNKKEDIFLSITETNCSILQILWLNNLYNTHALCANVGKCGHCKVEFLSAPPPPTKDEMTILSKEEIDTNIRLACKHSAKSDYYIKLFAYKENTNTQNTTDNQEISLIKKDKKNLKAHLVIDFGTTNVEYAFIIDEKIVQSASIINPMQGIGSEIMSRLEFAKDKKNASILKNRIWSTIGNIIKKEAYTIEKIIFSANSAMTYIALGLDTKCLATAPYSLDYTGNSIEKISYTFEDKKIKLPPVYIPPLLAPFIGGDISSGLLALEEKNLQYPYLFIDMGTNAEFVLALSENEKFIASVPLGPSVEGIGLSFGKMAKEENVIINFNLSPTGIKAVFLDKNQRDIEKARGISGIAYIHLIKLLKNINILDNDGHFNDKALTPLAQRIAQYFLYGEPKVECLKLSGKLFLSSIDIESILKVKAAFRTGFDILLDEAMLNTLDIKKVYLAGAFGKFIDKSSLLDLGFLPQALKNSIEQVGNTSLDGACILSKKSEAYILCDEAINSARQKHFKHVDLANNKNFAQFYMDNFNFNS